MTGERMIPSRRGCRWAVGLAVLAGLCGWNSQAPAAVLTASQLQAWGVATANRIEASLRVPGSNLYAETANLDGTRTGGVGNRSFVWPASTQFRVLNLMAKIFPATYTTRLRAFSDTLASSYVSSDGGYRSSISTGGDQFYDDNAHIVVALAEAYRITKDVTYLNRAKTTQAYVITGENTIGGGGIYFMEGDARSKDTISTLQGARGAAMLYNITGQASYLTDAVRLYDWSKTHVQVASGLYNQRWSISGNKADGIELVNSAGDAISLNLELYAATGESKYLTEAQRVGNAATSRYMSSSTGAFNDEAFWAYELADALVNLYAIDKQEKWLTKLSNGLLWLHANKEDANGHYGLFWGREGPVTAPLASWNLNEQAATARAYLYASTVAPVPEPTIASLVGAAGLMLGRRRRVATSST